MAVRSLIHIGKRVKDGLYLTQLLSVPAEPLLASLHSWMSRSSSETACHCGSFREADNSHNLQSVKARHKFSSARKSASGTVRQN